MDTDVAAKVAQFFSQYPQHAYAAKDILIQAHEDPTCIYYVVAGSVSQYDISPRGDEVVVNVFKPGAFFPMLWAITKRPNHYFFGAATAVTVRAAPYQDVLDFLQANPDVTYDLLARLYIGVDGLLGRMVQFMSGSAQGRVAYELVVTCRRFGEKTSDGSYKIAITEAELAARAGVSRETVSRELQKLAREQLVKTGRADITIYDIEALAHTVDAN